MNIRSLLILLLCWLGVHGLPQAQTTTTAGGEVLSIATRPGVRVPVFVVWNPQAKATVVLFSGGAGGYGMLGEDGWPASQNFLIRTGKVWAGHPFNVAMVGRPSDGIDLQDGAVRIGSLHSADNDAVFKALKSKSALPLWVVGTSMGTISAAAAAIQDTDHRIAGVVLTSSITAYNMSGAVPRQELEKIQVPTLVVHHARDSCKVCTPYEAKRLPAALKNAPIKALWMVEEGSGAVGNPCQALHYHGYAGAERAVVDRIARWIENPTPENPQP
jgi:pimeloyl-ACP methyl ester carboxylesterase